MKRVLSICFAFVLIVSVFSFVPSIEIKATLTTTYGGNLYVTKCNSLWTEPTTNALILVTPGNTLNGLYYDRIYAVYDSAQGGYVVQAKAGTHRTYSQVVASNAIGLAMSFQAGDDATGKDFARTNWEAWQHIKVGDVLKIDTGIDITKKTVSTSGTWGTDFVSNGIIKVYHVRDDSTPKTALSDKTIVFAGDSVTAGGGWVDDIAERYNCETINAAIPGDRTNEGLARFQSRVAVHNPDIVFIKYAINDALQYSITSSTFSNYVANMRSLITQSQALGAEVVLMTTNNVRTSTFESYSRYASFGGFTAFFVPFQEAIRDLAAEYDCHLIDVYAQWNGKTVDQYTIDTVHPSESGYQLDLIAIHNYLDAHIDEFATEPQTNSGDIVRTNIGSLRIDKYASIYTEPYNNTIAIVEGGTSMSNNYQQRIIAAYSESNGGYVVQQKIPAFRQSTATVPTGGIGLIFYYAPIVSLGSALARENWAIWRQIRVGDVLKPNSGIDLVNNTVSTVGSFGQSGYVSNAAISVTTVRDSSIEKTGYSDDIIVAYGDSVTAGGGWTDDLSLEFNANFINAATPGYTSSNAVSTFDSHVAVHNPDIVILMFGINDAISSTITTSTLTTFISNMTTLYNKCVAIGAKPIFMTTNNVKVSYFAGNTRYDSVGGFESYFPKYQQAIRDLAAAKGAHCIDIYANWESLDYTSYLFDTVHPNSSGYDVTLNTMINYLRANEVAIAGVVPGVDYEAFTLKDNAANYSVVDSYMKGLEAGVTVDSFVDSFMSTIEVLDSNGNTMNDTDNIKTGCIIRNKFQNGSYVDTVAVVRSDINGDGTINTGDVIIMARILKKGVLSGTAYYEAADISADGVVNTIDIIGIKKIIKG